MPKFILKNFEDSNHKFCYYDVEKGFIGTGGHSESLYTQKDYYSQRMENYLNNEFEKPFSEIVNFIKSVIYKHDGHRGPGKDIEKKCIDFVKMLVARDEMVQNQAKKVMVHSQFAKKIDISDQVRRDTVVALSLKNLNEMPYIDNRFVSFSINQTDMPFVLPTCDVIEYGYGPYNCISIAVNPQILITLIDKKHLKDFIIDDGYIRFIPLKDTRDIIVFNETAFNNQKKHGYGYVVSNDLAVLEELQKK